MAESFSITIRDGSFAAVHIPGMEPQVPARYDPREAYKRFRAELFRAHSIDLADYGGTKEAANLLGTTQQAVSNWKRRGLPMWVMLKIDTETKMDANYIYQLGERTKIKDKLEKEPTGQTELLKQLAKLLQPLMRKPKR
jgi:hypothetical protein